MPYSVRDNDADIIKYVEQHGLKSLLDIGAGSGTYGTLLRPYMTSLVAVEVWEPYVGRFGLHAIYDDVIVSDVRRLLDTTVEPRYDLIVFGDILEHMSSAHGRHVWQWAASVARHGVISVPTVHWPQGEVNGNPHEAHVQDCVSTEDYAAVFGPFDRVDQYAQTATFYKEF